eukprot:m51a1_g1626 putative tyrosine (1043) ;mRNA; r:253022-256548
MLLRFSALVSLAVMAPLLRADSWPSHMRRAPLSVWAAGDRSRAFVTAGETPASGAPNVTLTPLNATLPLEWSLDAGGPSSSNVSYVATPTFALLRAGAAVDLGGGAPVRLVGLAGAGAVPSAAEAWAVGIECAAAFTARVGVRIIAWDAETGDVYAPIDLAVTWTCAVPGCAPECGSPGRGHCIVPLGQCVCEDGYEGVSCMFRVAMNRTVCPGDAIDFGITILGAPSGREWLSSSSPASPDTDWRYVASWSVTPSIALVNSSATQLQGGGLIEGYLPPGVYTTTVYRNDLYLLLGTTRWTVLPYSSCGHNTTCAGNSSCGPGLCEGGTCSCPDTLWGPFCERGCDPMTVLSASSGTIRSDKGTASALSSRYTANTVCTWRIVPDLVYGDDYTQIVVRVPWIDISDGDKLTFSTIGAHDNVTLVESFSLGALPFTRVLQARGLELSLITDYSNGGRGFALSYRVNKTTSGTSRSLSAGVLAAIVVPPSALLAASILGFALLVTLRRGRASAEAETNYAATIAPDDAADGRFIAVEELEKAGVQLSKKELLFGVPEKEAFPVFVEKEDSFSIVNHTVVPLVFAVRVPDASPAFHLSASPGTGALKPLESVEVKLQFKLLYTTQVSTFVAVQVDEDKSAMIGKTRLGINISGSLSDRLDPKEIILDPSAIGGGSFGSVYKGKYRNRLIAVKVMRKQQVMTALDRAAFDAETELYRKLRNPYIVEFVGASHVPEKLCICCELVERGSLDELIFGVEIPYPLQLKFAMNIASAMTFLHSNNVLYRDLKPSNVLIASTSLKAEVNCKLADFGTARNVTDVLMCSPYNCKADVYSFAIVAWQMYSRELPWKDVPVWDVPDLVTSGQRPPFPPGMPNVYAEFIGQCWAADIEQRPLFLVIPEMLRPMFKQAKKAAREVTEVRPRTHSHGSSYKPTVSSWARQRARATRAKSISGLLAAAGTGMLTTSEGEAAPNESASDAAGFAQEDLSTKSYRLSMIENRTPPAYAKGLRSLDQTSDARPGDSDAKASSCDASAGSGAACATTAANEF